MGSLGNDDMDYFFLIVRQRSMPYSTVNVLPLSQCTSRLPVSSTPTTVPLVPIGGAWASSICTSTIRVPAGYVLRSCSSLSLFGYLIRVFFLSAIFKGRGAGKVLQEQLPFVLVFLANKPKAKQKAAEVVFLVD